MLPLVLSGRWHFSLTGIPRSKSTPSFTSRPSPSQEWYPQLLCLLGRTFSLFVNSIQATESPVNAVSKTDPESVHFAPIFTTTAFVPATGITTASCLASLWSPTPVRFPRRGSDHVTSRLPHLSLPSCPLQRRKSRLHDMI